VEPNWEHIKREISSKETPLSPDAWKNMDGLLEANAPKKKAVYWWLLAPALLLLFLPTYWLMQSNEVPEIPEAEIEITNEAFPTKEVLPQVLEKKANEEAVAQEENSNVEVGKPKDKNSSTQKSRGEVSTSPNTQNKQAVAISPSKKESSVEPNSAKGHVEVIMQAPSMELSSVESETDSTKKAAEGILIIGQNNFYDSADVHLPDENWLDKSNKGIWELKLFAGPSYNMPNITYNSVENYSHRDYENATDNSVKAGWGFDAGLEISYFLTPHFKLSTGINYREIVTTNNMNYSVADIPVIDSASGQILGYITLPNATNYSSTTQNSFVYVGVPVSLFQEIPLRGRFSLTAEFVNTFSFLLKQNSEDINPTTLQIEGANDDMFNPLLVNYQLRLGLRYTLNQNLIFALEPAYRGTYNNMYNSDYISWKPSDFSLNAAIIIQLRKK